MSIRVVVADDQQIVREGFTALLETQADITVVGSAADGEEAIRVCGEQQPDVVLMDVRMPGVDGIEATAPSRGTKVIILTTFDLDDYVYDALQRRRERLPAQGRARRASCSRRCAWSRRARRCWRPTVTRRLIAEFARQRPRVRPTPERLSELTAARDRGAAADRRRPLQPRDRRPPRAQRRDRQDPRQPCAAQARPARPHPGRGGGLRVGPRRRRAALDTPRTRPP